MADDGKLFVQELLVVVKRIRVLLRFLNSANGVTIVALGDMFEEKVDELADKLKQTRDIDIPRDKRFVGLDAYKHVVDSGVDVVIDCTPPFFRPAHFEYIVNKTNIVLLKSHCLLMQ